MGCTDGCKRFLQKDGSVLCFIHGTTSVKLAVDPVENGEVIHYPDKVFVAAYSAGVLTLEEIATEFNVTRKTVYNALARHKIKVNK